MGRQIRHHQRAAGEQHGDHFLAAGPRSSTASTSAALLSPAGPGWARQFAGLTAHIPRPLPRQSNDRRSASSQSGQPLARMPLSSNPRFRYRRHRGIADRLRWGMAKRRPASTLTQSAARPAAGQQPRISPGASANGPITAKRPGQWKAAARRFHSSDSTTEPGEAASRGKRFRRPARTVALSAVPPRDRRMVEQTQLLQP